MKELLSLEMGHRRARILVFSVVIGCLLISVTSVIMAFKYSNDFSQRVYVISQNTALEALSSNVRDNREAEARFHVARFHELFFNLSPDGKSIENNFNRASYLCDESAKTTFDKLKEDQFFHQLIQTNTTQKLEIDKIDLDMKNYPYTATVTFRLFQERATSRSTRIMVTHCQLVDVNRSEANANGFLMRNFKIMQQVGKIKIEKLTMQ